MTTVGFAILLFSILVMLLIGYTALLHQSAKSIALLIAALPILNLTQKSFPETAPLFPSMETLAVAIMGIFMLISIRERLPSMSKLGRSGVLLLYIFLFLSLLSAIISEDPARSARILLAGGLAPAVCYYLTSRSAQKPHDVQLIILGILCMGIIAGMYTFMNLMNRIGFLGGVLDVGTYKFVYNEAPIVNFFTVPSAAVAATSPVLPLALWYGKYGRNYRLPIMFVAAFSSLFISLFSLSRGSWLSTLFVGVLSLVYLYRGGHLRFIVALCIVISLVVFAGFDRFITPLLESRFHQATGIGADSSTEARLANYMLSIEAGLYHPILGVGLGNYPDIYKEIPNSVPQLIFAHSLLLTLIPEVGALGAAVFALFFAVHISEGFRCRYVSQVDADLGHASAVGLLGLLVVASTSGSHLVNSINFITEWTYFCAPMMIVACTLMGTIAGRAKPALSNANLHNLKLSHVK